MTPSDLDDAALAFVTERHLATFTTVDSRGRPHSIPVGFTWDPESGLARIITRRQSKKAVRLIDSPGSPVSVCQVDGGRWLAMEGTAVVTDDADRVQAAVDRYADRYRQPEANPDRVAIEITVTNVIGRW